MNGTPVRIQGESDVIAEIASIFRETPDVEALRLEEGNDTGIGADFGLEAVSALVGIVSAVFFDGPIVPKLLSLFRRKPGTRIVVETPTRSVTIEATGDLSAESLRAVLLQLVQV